MFGKKEQKIAGLEPLKPLEPQVQTNGHEKMKVEEPVPVVKRETHRCFVSCPIFTLPFPVNAPKSVTSFVADVLFTDDIPSHWFLVHSYGNDTKLDKPIRVYLNNYNTIIPLDQE